jgi:hypothetical protein
MTGLGVPPGALRTEAVAINNAGQVICIADPGFAPYYAGRPFLWDDGVWTDLGFSYANSVDINDRGQILAWIQGQSLLLTPDTTPAFTINDVIVTEGNDSAVTAVFTVTRSGPTDQVATIAYATTNGIAAASSDYEAASGTLTFAQEESSKTVTITIYGDRLAEPNETFFVNLSQATGAIVADGQGAAIIVDDEPRISINDVSMAEGKRGQTTLFTFTVTLSAAYDQPVTMSFRTGDGTALPSKNAKAAITE